MLITSPAKRLASDDCAAAPTMTPSTALPRMKPERLTPSAEVRKSASRPYATQVVTPCIATSAPRCDPRWKSASSTWCTVIAPAIAAATRTPTRTTGAYRGGTMWTMSVWTVSTTTSTVPPAAAAAQARAAPATWLDSDSGARRIHMLYLPSTGRGRRPVCTPHPPPYPGGPAEINVAPGRRSGLGTACEVGADEAEHAEDEGEHGVLVVARLGA